MAIDTKVYLRRYGIFSDHTPITVSQRADIQMIFKTNLHINKIVDLREMPIHFWECEV